MERGKKSRGQTTKEKTPSFNTTKTAPARLSCGTDGILKAPMMHRDCPSVSLHKANQPELSGD